MKVSYEEDLANRFGLQRRGDSGNGIVLSVRAKGNAGQLLSSDITPFVCRSCPDSEKATSCVPIWQGASGHGGVYDPVHAWTFQTRRKKRGRSSFIGSCVERNEKGSETMSCVPFLSAA
jgi:hypothetical protein